MNASAGKQRSKAGRPATNKRGRQFDKAVMNDGVYANPRVVHSTLNLVGCSVQVTVKNGGVYEGILRTISPSSQIVLDVAHKVDPSIVGKNYIPPSKMLINSIIFNLSDVVTVSAHNVDLEFANKDNFTDSAISKFNNGDNSLEKELQPWDGGPGSEVDLDSLEKPVESNSSNGWDAEDMFNVNKAKFKVESSYDPALSQYTTPLVRRDTKEYREKEAMAAQLASEIEKSDDYDRRNALENGDGNDEELAFSAVIRSNPETNNNSSNSGKYVPPHQRKTQQGGRPARIVTSQTGVALSGSPSPSSQQASPSLNTSAPSLVAHIPQRPTHPAPVNSVSVSVSVASSDTSPEDAPTKSDETRPSDINDRGKSAERSAAPSYPSMPQQPPQDRRPINTNRPARDTNKIHQELKHFRNQFKLQDSYSKESPVERKLSQPSSSVAGPSSSPSPSSSQGQFSQPPPQPPTNMGPPHQAPQAHIAAPHQAPPTQHHPQPQQPESARVTAPVAVVHTSNAPSSQQLGSQQQVTEKPVMATPSTAVASAAVMDKKEDEKKETENEDRADKKSQLNPYAKEFVPGGFKPRPQQPAPNSTPPRVAAQSPVVNIPFQTGPAAATAVYYPHLPAQAAAAMMQNPQAPRINNKKAVVSAVRPDLSAAAATGQPLLQNPMVQSPSYTMHHPAAYNFPLANATPQGSIPQQPLVVPSANPRMMTPSLIQSATTPTDPVAYNPNQQNFYVSPQGAPNAMQAYMAPTGPPPPSAGATGGQQVPPPHSVAMPVHMGPHATPPHSQTVTHMSSQSGTSGGHHNPSPVPQPGPGSHGHPQQSGTPQPGHVIYQGGQTNPQHGSHPPLQPSPHTPTSPIYQQPVTLAYPSYPVVQPHMATGAPQHTTVTNASHTQHSHVPCGHGGQQVFMMTAQTLQQGHHPSHSQPVNPQMAHNAAAAAAGAPHAANHQYPINATGQHPQAHPTVQGGHLHGQAGTGLQLNLSYQHPQMGPPFHHNQ